MTMVFDIGNSSIKGALFDGDQIVETRTIVSGASDFDLEAVVVSLSRGTTVSSASCVSVVPATTIRLSVIVASVFGISLKVLTTKSSVPIEIAYLTPETLGVDRVAAAVAAWMMYGNPESPSPRNVLVIDAGTTTTFEVVTADGVYRGGSIAPGPGLMRSALNQGTAQLPLVELELPESPIGRSTDEALRSGVLFGYLGSVEKMIARISATFTDAPVIVATGGWAGWLAELLPEIEIVEPHLVLHGVRLISLA